MIWAELKNRWNKEQFNEEQQAVIAASWPGYNPKSDGSFDIPYNSVRMTWDEYRRWFEAGIDLEIRPCASTMNVKRRDVTADPDNAAYQDFANGKLFNVTIPDVGLLSITEVSWLENACTEELQEQLNRGWRILAVCPPNAQRRPDYILGRSVKETR